MIKNKRSIRRHIVLNAALAVTSVSLLTACGSSSGKAGETTEVQKESTVSANQDTPENSAANDAPEEETDDFFSIMQKFSAGEIEAVPFDDLKTLEGQYGVAALAEEAESGLKLYGYIEPENQYTGVYVVNESNTVNAFPDLIYTTDALVPPTLQWDSQEKILQITSYKTEGGTGSDSEIYSFRQLDNGLLVSLDEEPEEEEETTEEASYLQSDITLEEAAEGVTAFLDLLNANDKEAVAGMLSYPSTLTVPSGEYVINSPEEFLPHYDEFFTEEFKNQFSGTEPDVFLHNGLISFAEGQIWFVSSGEDHSLKVTAINGIGDSSFR